MPLLHLLKKLEKTTKYIHIEGLTFLDSISSALGYIFPWSGGVLLGIATINQLSAEYNYISPINPAEAVPFVFHGWFLVIVMLIAALTGLGLRYEGSNGEELKEKPE